MQEIKIENRKVGHGNPPFIVAEAGINHNGEIEKAFELIRLAKNSGADAVKFQTFTAEKFVSDKDVMYTYQSAEKEITEPLIDILKRCEFVREEWKKIKKKCDEEKITFLSTAQNRSDLDLLLEIGISAIKIGSDDFTNLPLLKNYTNTGLPLILSSGMANLSEIRDSLETVGAQEGYPTILLVCTSEYPTPPEDVNLLKFKTLSSTFPFIPLGFSDHTIGPLASSLAVANGACLLEKHFTINRNLPGPDHWFAEDPSSLTTYVNSIRTAYKMMGDPTVKPTKKEEEMKKIARRSIFTLKEIKKDEKLDDSNIGLRRPGTGLPPKIFPTVLGKKANKDLPKLKLLELGDFR